MDDIRADGYRPTIRKRALGRKLVELRKTCGRTLSEPTMDLSTAHWHKTS